MNSEILLDYLQDFEVPRKLVDGPRVSRDIGSDRMRDPDSTAVLIRSFRDSMVQVRFHLFQGKVRSKFDEVDLKTLEAILPTDEEVSFSTFMSSNCISRLSARLPDLSPLLIFRCSY